MTDSFIEAWIPMAISVARSTVGACTVVRGGMRVDGWILTGWERGWDAGGRVAMYREVLRRVGVVSTRWIRGVAERGLDGWIYARIGGIARICCFTGMRLLVWVVLRLGRLMMLVDGLVSMLSGEGEEDEEEGCLMRISRRPSFSARPSCQVAFAHHPTTSSLMLSSFSLRDTRSRTQRGKM